MYTWVFYDISDNKTRHKIATCCRNIGLRRVQKSVFLGMVKKKHLKRLVALAKERLDQERDSMLISSMSKEAFEQVQLLGRPNQKPLLPERELTSFL